MKSNRFALFALVFIATVRCSTDDEKPLLFFSKMNKAVSFPITSPDGHPDFGLDSVVLTSQYTIDVGDTTYLLNTTSRSIFNLKGFLRLNDRQIVQIMAIDENTDIPEGGKWQDLFDFRTSGQSDTIVYSRNGIQYQMVVTPEQEYYHEKIMDSVTSFRLIKEDEFYMSRSEYLIDISLKEGFVNCYVYNGSDNSIYTLGYFPPRILRKKDSNPAYPQL